jgi:hypothetical protein
VIIDNATPLAATGGAKDSVSALLRLAEFQVSGHAGDQIALAINANGELSGADASAALVIDVDGTSEEYPLKTLPASIDVFSFATAQSVGVKYSVRRGTLRRPAADVRLIQQVTGGSVTHASTPWHRAALATRARLCSGGSCGDSSVCEITAATGTCGSVDWAVTPFYTPSTWSAEEFQSDSGTSASRLIAITFSKPIQAANILIEDPTFVGNTATAYDSSGAFAFSDFAYSDSAGVNHPDSASFSGSINMLVLNPAHSDYVAYDVVITLKPRIVISFDTASTPMNNGIPLLLPKEFARADIKPTYSGAAWPDSMQFRIRIDSAGHPLSNRTIGLVVIPVDSGGSGSDGSYGHHHFGVSGGPAKPRGTVPATVSTGDSIGTFTYRSSQYSAPETIRATYLSADTALARLAVGVDGLHRVDSSSTILWIGPTIAHPTADSHYATDSMETMLSTLASSFAAAHHGKPLPLNDMSLPWGGRFDYDTAKLWSGGHVEHRAGRSADIRTKAGAPGALTYMEKNWVFDFWNDSLHGCVHPEPAPQEHWHLQQSKELGITCKL